MEIVYTASDSELNVNSLTLIAGTIVAPPAPRASEALMRIEGPIISRLFRKKIGDSLKRKFLIGCEILPFSIRYVPSRVRPVLTTPRASTPRIYQNRLTT